VGEMMGRTSSISNADVIILRKVAMKIVRITATLLAACILACSKNPTSTEEDNDRPQIEVQSPITENTTWESGNDYLIRGVVRVEQSALLTIQPDVHVYFDEDDEGNKGKLYVEGGIHADGGGDTTIVFKALEKNNFTGIEISENDRNIILKFIKFDGGTQQISSIRNNLIIDNCEFINSNRSIVISKSTSVIISETSFKNVNIGIKFDGCKGDNLDNIAARNNFFQDCQDCAIEVNNTSCLIYSNTFLNNAIGIKVHWRAISNIENNNITNNNIGLEYEYWSGGEVKYNSISECGIGVYLYWNNNPIINNNNIYNNNNYNVKLEYNDYMNTNENLVDGKNNWWGTINVNEISDLIFDENDPGTNEYTGKIIFEPFLLSSIN
jgi:hypothetical protein